MVQIIREIAKTIIICMIWTLPVVLTIWSGDRGNLWFMVLSFIVTVGVLTHYETIETMDSINFGDTENLENNGKSDE